MSNLEDNKKVSANTTEIEEIILEDDDTKEADSEAAFENVDFTVDISDILDAEERDKKKKKRHTIGKVCILVVELFVILVTSFVLFLLVTPNSKAMLINSWIGRMFIKMVVSDEDYNNILDTEFNKDNLDVNEGVNILEEYTNIALFGLDSRYGELDQGVRSDTIIIVSINNKTKEVKMCSVYRDNWLRVVNKDGSAYYGKVNNAYAYGGPEAAVKTLNQNLDLNITDYASVNFYGISRIIDMLGGIDVNITSTEMYWINQYLGETRIVTGIDSPLVSSYGQVHLNGIQATAFCRIRYTTFTDEDGNKYNWDFGRTARQRFVISQLVDKAKAAGVSKILDIAEEIFTGDEEIIKTSIPYDDLLDMIPVLIDFNISGQAGFPFTYTSPDEAYTNNESSVVAQGLSYNVKKLHQFLFNDYDYEPSKVVEGISESLQGITHVEEVTLPEDAVENETDD